MSRRVIALALVTGLVAGAWVVNHGRDGVTPRTVALDGYPSAVIVDSLNGRAFVADRDDNVVSVVDIRRARRLFDVRVGSEPAALALDERTRHLFVANARNSTVSVVDARSGSLLATTAVGVSPDQVAVDSRTSRVFVVDDTYAGVIVLDAASGRVLRTTHVGLYPQMIALEEGTGRVFVAGQDDARVALLDARDGRLLRRVAVGGAPTLLAMDRQTARVFVATSSQPGGARLDILDARSGAVRHTATLRHGAVAMVADARTGRVVVEDDGGGIDVLDGHSGLQVGRLPMSGMTFALDARRGRLIAVGWGGETGPADLTVVGTPAGAVLYRTLIPNAGMPYALAVDERTGNAVVISGNGTVQQHGPWDWLPSHLPSWLSWLRGNGPRARTVPPSVTIVKMSGE